MYLYFDYCLPYHKRLHPLGLLDCSTLLTVIHERYCLCLSPQEWSQAHWYAPDDWRHQGPNKLEVILLCATSPDLPEILESWQQNSPACCYFINLNFGYTYIDVTDLQSQLLYPGSNVLPDLSSPDGFPSALSFGLYPPIQPPPQSISYHPQVSVESRPLLSFSNIQSQLDSFNLCKLT